MTKARASRAATVVCALVVMALAVAVRMPSCLLVGADDATRAAYTSESGLPYLIDQDSYYHVRIVDNQLALGSQGDATAPDGTPWDSTSFFPEGRSAVYQPGIVWLTTAVWKGANALFGIDLGSVEYVLAALMSALAGLAAFAVGYRMGGRVGGLVAGVLVACSPAFALRTVFGRYDTDLFVVLMDVLLLLAITEALRARTLRARIGWSAAFGGAVLLYGVCWAAQFAMLFAAVLLVGGMMFAIVAAIVAGLRRRARSRKDATLASHAGVTDDASAGAAERGRGGRAFAALALCAGCGAIAVLLLDGPSLFGSIAGAFVQSAAVTASGTLPNLFVSVTELKVAPLVPASPLQWFVGLSPTASSSVLGGVGGIVAAALCAAGLVRLAVQSLGRVHAAGFPLTQRECALYFCVIGFFLVGSLYAVGRGVRFVEHLSVSVGILAGAFIGWAAHDIRRETWKAPAVKPLLCAVLVVAALAPTLVGSASQSAALRPSVSDASADAMAWVRDNADDQRAVVASWWDDGYFYESVSGHPCLWDGGSMDGVRAILVGKALTCDDPELARRILIMLAHSGNSVPETLMQHADAKTAFEAVWDALPLDGARAQALLAERCGLSTEQAREAESLMHPAAAPEIYLALTDAMMERYGWFEYFANWDFTGSAPAPGAVRFDRAPDGRALFDTDDEAALDYLDYRSSQLAWRLFVDGDAPDGFAPVFDERDPVARVALWKIA